MKIKLNLVALMVFLSAFVSAQQIPNEGYSVALSQDGSQLLVVWSESSLSAHFGKNGEVDGMSFLEMVEGERMITHLFPTEVSPSPFQFTGLKTWTDFAKKAWASIKPIGNDLFVEKVHYVYLGTSTVRIDHYFEFSFSKGRGLVFQSSQSEGALLVVPLEKWLGPKLTIGSSTLIGHDGRSIYYFPVSLQGNGEYLLSKEVLAQLKKDEYPTAPAKSPK